MLTKIVVLLLSFSIRFQHSSLSSTNESFYISLIHFNDFHSRYEPVNNATALCKQEPCIGGFSRLYATIKQLINERTNPIVLCAGDNFKGSLWYHLYKWNVTQYFFNKLPLDAMTIGNHEFDNGIDGLVPFLQRIRTPIVCCNIDNTDEPRLEGLYNKSVIIERNGKKIGIIGVLLKETVHLSSVGKLKFLDESLSVNQEADNLVRNHRVFTNIILSHCGYEKDIEIAKNSTSKIRIIVGGHTDTFLYSGTPSPGPDKPSGPYPTIVRNRDGKKVLIVQASAYTKYLGDLTVVFNDDGDIRNCFGTPIFLDSTYPTDAGIDRELQVWKKDVDALGERVVGQALFTMMNKPCRIKECLLGNFATDAMVFSFIDKSDDDSSWTYASLAMIHAGGMRVPIIKGNITFNDLMTTFPFQDSLNVYEISGGILNEILEGMVEDQRLKNPHFFQFSGIHVVFNVSKPEHQRIESLKIRCRQCRIPEYQPINYGEKYRVVLPGFLVNTEFNPLLQRNARQVLALDAKDLDVYMKYLDRRSPIYQEIEGRIIVTI